MDYSKALLQAGMEMVRRGLTVETWGNISLRSPVTGHIYLTPSAMAYDTLTPQDVVVLDAQGNLVRGHRKPSIEKDLHLAIYQQRPDVGAVLHTHPIDSSVFACLGWEIPLLLDESVQTLIQPVQVAAYALPGTLGLARNAVAALGGQGRACLLQSHGAVCVGQDLAAAFRVAEVLEMTAKIYWRLKPLGQPLAHSPQTLELLRQQAQTYGQPKEARP